MKRPLIPTASRVNAAASAFAGAFALILVGACEGVAPAPAASASGSAVAASSAAPKASDPYPRAEDDTLPVYRPTNDPPDPLAEKYCDLVHEASERARVSCCPDTTFTPFRPTTECVRTLSIALQSGAVTIKDGALDACAKAVDVKKPCDAPDILPDACVGIFVGHRDEQVGCRSALECKEGLYCRGLGVSAPGRCTPPDPVGATCAEGVDALASFVRQDAAASHPICHDVCFQQRCRAFVKEGGKCTTAVECGPGSACRAGSCKAGPPEPSKLARLGDACKADADCMSGACEEKKCAMRCTLKLPASPPPKPDSSH